MAGPQPPARAEANSASLPTLVHAFYGHTWCLSLRGSPVTQFGRRLPTGKKHWEWIPCGGFEAGWGGERSPDINRKEEAHWKNRCDQRRQVPLHTAKGCEEVTWKELQPHLQLTAHRNKAPRWLSVVWSHIAHPLLTKICRAYFHRMWFYVNGCFAFIGDYAPCVCSAQGRLRRHC